MDRQEEDDDAALREAGGGASFPGGWLRRLSRELRWSFVLAVVAVYGACQGVGDAVGGVTAGYYWKDVQRVQPSAAQFYQGFVSAPWVVKPIWGLLTDVVPVAGYRRRPLSLDIQAGMFYWYTDPIVGPGFSEEFIGLVYSVGSIGSLLGVLLYQISLKDYPFRGVLFWGQDCPFRGVLFWGQVLSSLAGMLNLIMVTRFNTRIGIPDYVFAVIDNSVSQMVGRLKWLPLLVLCSKLCPPGIEGTFYALLMSIQNAGLLMSGWWGGLMLHLLNVTRTEFSNLWKEAHSIIWKDIEAVPSASFWDV
uniref:Uncharacterized protein n=1 Tax=Oryza rufipogon TaxID=4529 RepID=A0A0E0PLQ8_ORYRU